MIFLSGKHQSRQIWILVPYLNIRTYVAWLIQTFWCHCSPIDSSRFSFQHPERRWEPKFFVWKVASSWLPRTKLCQLCQSHSWIWICRKFSSCALIFSFRKFRSCERSLFHLERKLCVVLQVLEMESNRLALRYRRVLLATNSDPLCW